MTLSSEASHLGAGSDISCAAAEHFTSLGGKLMLNDLNEESVAETKRICCAKYRTAHGSFIAIFDKRCST